jgi:hypothetical protein
MKLFSLSPVHTAVLDNASRRFGPCGRVDMHKPGQKRALCLAQTDSGLVLEYFMIATVELVIR